MGAKPYDGEVQPVSKPVLWGLIAGGGFSLLPYRLVVIDQTLGESFRACKV